MTNYYVLAVNSLIKTFSILDAGNTVSFGLTTQDTNALFSEIKIGDRILGYMGVPVNRIKYLFTVIGVETGSQIELVKQIEVSEGVSMHNFELERQIETTELIEIDKTQFDLICKELVEYVNDEFKTEEEIEAGIDESAREADGTNILLYGVPGCGKSWTIQHEYCEPGTHVERLVFHPDYTNADFIGQILPVVDEDKQVTYEFVAGPFTNILRDAYHNPQRKFVLIIEEINRGNAPAIFGDVFQLLDRTVEKKTVDDITYNVGTSEYGITNENIANWVYGNSKQKVFIPSNLSIFGTMNTSDQNVFTLDTAFQRRWKMRLIENNFDNVRDSLANALILDTGVTWELFCTTINKIIVGNKSKVASAEDKRLGVYFLHESDLEYDNRDVSADGNLLKEYNTLLKAERKKQITSEQTSRLSDIRAALKQNRVFPEKVIKYLWDDAFKFTPEAIFDTERFDCLEDIIRDFIFSKGTARFNIFKQGLRDNFYPQQ